MGNILFTDTTEQKKIKQLYEQRSNKEMDIIIDNIHKGQSDPRSFVEYIITAHNWNDKVNNFKIQEYYKRYLINNITECGFGVINNGLVLHIYWSLDQYNKDNSKSPNYNFEDYELL